jgi:hypothetical protein
MVKQNKKQNKAKQKIKIKYLKANKQSKTLKTKLKQTKKI